MIQVADSLDILIVSLSDIFTEGNHMVEKDALQTGAAKAAPGSAAAAGSPAAPGSPAAAGSPADQQEAGDDAKQGAFFDFVDMVGTMTGEEGQVHREALIESLTAALGVKDIAEQVDTIDKKLKILLGISAKLERIEQKFTGIGKALDVIAQQVQRKATASGPNGGD